MSHPPTFGRTPHRCSPTGRALRAAARQPGLAESDLAATLLMMGGPHLVGDAGAAVARALGQLLGKPVVSVVLSASWRAPPNTFSLCSLRQPGPQEAGEEACGVIPDSMFVLFPVQLA